MLEMIVYKSRDGRSLTDQFSNSYLFNGAPNYLSDAALTVAQNLVLAERRIYFDNVHFMRTVIRQLDATGKHIEGETRVNDTNTTGLTPMPETAELMPPNVVVAYAKRVNVGRKGITLYRNCVTSDEYNTYIETGTIPDRLRTSMDFTGHPTGSFVSRLMAVEGDTGLDMILPINSRYANGAARSIVGIEISGIRFRQETHQRDTGEENLVEAVQQLINENARAIRRLLKRIEGATGGLVPSLIQSIIQLVIDAVAKYGLLTIARRAAIRWPAIYFVSQLIELLPPGTLPQLTA